MLVTEIHYVNNPIRTVQVLNSQCAGGPRGGGKTFGGGMPPGPPSGYGPGCSNSSRCCNTCTADNIELVDKLLSHKNGQAKNNICTLYLILRHYCLQKIINIG